jgi:hypothetical protein
VLRLSALAALLVGCTSSGDTNGSGASSGSAVKKGSGGFSAALSADLARDGTGDVKPAAPTERKPAPPPDDRARASVNPPPAPPPSPAPPAGSGRPSAPGKRGPTKVPAELAAIKLDLEPNWDRDYDGAGTFGFELKVPNTHDTRVFFFHYGYDDAKAPADRDQYLRWVADAKLLTPTLDRQRGAAWYLEGTDPAGAHAFRYVINYGGKHLICYGSQYKDAASNALGDLRDKVVMQAKKICETLSL